MILFLLPLSLGIISIYSVKKINIEREVIIEIPKNYSLNEITRILYKNKIIENEFIFKSYSFLTNKFNLLKAGEYSFGPIVSNKEVIKKLYTNDVYMYKVTIPECYSNIQIFEKLINSNLILDAVEEVYVEGDFFPDTYYYSKDTKLSKLLEKMHYMAKQKYKGALIGSSKNLEIKYNRRELIILASMVEAEAKKKKEKRKIASVFYNRLKIGMKLQSDPTIIYGINKTVYLDRALSKKDILLDHAWNTYKIEGLPPTPICNVGVDSINAVLNPEKTDYLYFVANKSGEHYFSKTYAEHLNYIKIIREK